MLASYLTQKGEIRVLKTNTIYNFKDVMEELHIPYSQWRRRKEDLKEWLGNFYDYDIQEGRPITFIIYKIYGEYKLRNKKIAEGYEGCRKGAETPRPVIQSWRHELINIL